MFFWQVIRIFDFLSLSNDSRYLQSEPLKTWSLLCVVLQDIAIFMYKIKHKLLSERLCNLFQLDSGLYNLRKREFVQPRFSSVTYGKHSLRYLGPKLWNDLTPRLRNLPSLKQFKNVIRDRDLTALAANVSDCRGCNLCQE